VVLHALGRDAECKPLLIDAVAGLAGINSSTKAMFIGDVIDMLLEYERPDLVQTLTPAQDVRLPQGLDGQLARARGKLQLLHEDREAEATLVEAVAGLRAGGSPFPLARGLLDLGALVAERARPQEAAPLLQEAHSIFAGLRATPWLQRAQAIMAPTATAR
jgi:hypothetical protein